MTFQLHPQLQKDCIRLGRLELCQLLLMNDSQFPWFILVPEIGDIREIYQLAPTDRSLLQEESCQLAERLAGLFKADKMNVAAIGNLVPQLHIHHIVRYRLDKAWPAPVWGKFDAVPYTEHQLEELLPKIKSTFDDLLTREL
ncbi:MAG: HIT domain-containing protein [Gammaproteobacteria bacterium]|uniref:HIT domain-containing protein n=1 Tax=unclassified Methylotuvimicrobium TaxID=2822412 RepID=UPI001DF790CA|nr:HIT domain-containing protein [Gammaproteobacteria bacterium]